MIEAFGLDKLTAYKVKLSNKSIFLDFGAKTIKPSDIKDVDYIFISHEHLDHWEMLMDYNLIKDLNPNCQIFCTKTTKEIIKNLFIQNEKKKRHKEEVFLYMTSIIDRISTITFTKEIYLKEDLSFTLFRSGHTFGSAMIYLNSKEEKILYTGDFDYVKNDVDRQYYVPYGLKVDTLIVDGTNIVKREHKGIRIDQIRTYIKRNGNCEYQIRPEKAVFYAKYISSRIDDCIILYTESMRWYLDIISNNGYNAFINGRVMYEFNNVNYEEEYPHCTIIKLSTKKDKYMLDTKLGLHITKHNLKSFINETFDDEPKRIFVGHYNLKDAENFKKSNTDKFTLLVSGVNIYE